jgi:RanGTP-binding protein
VISTNTSSIITMDILLSKVTQQAMNYAIRSGVTLTASYAIKQSARLLQNVPESNDHDQLQDLQQRLHGKIRIISPAIDMIELIAARGNTSLESAVALTKELRWEIQSFGQRMASVAANEEAAQGSSRSAQAKAKSEVEIRLVIASMKKLLGRIEDAVPLISLAITTSGASLSSRLPPTVSPSRLLQASTLLNAGDMQYCMTPDEAVQIGPSFTLTVYMLFSGHVRPHDEASIRETTWKEVMHKARVKLRRVPMQLVQPEQRRTSQPSTPSSNTVDDSLALQIPVAASVDEYAYQMMLIEDLDDDRFHTTEDEEVKPGPFDDVEQAGIRETFPVFQIGKIFYADTGKVLNIGSEESNSPVLLLKRDLNAPPPRSLMRKDELVNEDEADQTTGGDGPVSVQSTTGTDPWSLPPGLDPEWIALEIYSEAEDFDDESETEEPSSRPRQSTRSPSVDPQLASSMASLMINGESCRPPTASPNHVPTQSSYGLTTTQPPAWMSNVQTSLSLLEVLLRLVALSEYLQTSHLSANDQWLNFFLEESKATGAEGDENSRQRVRADARRRVGFDPYDESPVKRRGEEYQYQAGVGVGDGDGEEWHDSSRSQRWSSPGPSRYQENGAAWTSPSMQTRSMTGFSDSKSPSPLSPAKDRKNWLKRRDERTGSPLRPTTGNSDEGIGTSPGSGHDAEPA